MREMNEGHMPGSIMSKSRRYFKQSELVEEIQSREVEELIRALKHQSDQTGLQLLHRDAKPHLPSFLNSQGRFYSHLRLKNKQSQGELKEHAPFKLRSSASFFHKSNALNPEKQKHQILKFDSFLNKPKQLGVFDLHSSPRNKAEEINQLPSIPKLPGGSPKNLFTEKVFHRRSLSKDGNSHLKDSKISLSNQTHSKIKDVEKQLSYLLQANTSVKSDYESYIQKQSMHPSKRKKLIEELERASMVRNSRSFEKMSENSSVNSNFKIRSKPKQNAVKIMHNTFTDEEKSQCEFKAPGNAEDQPESIPKKSMNKVRSFDQKNEEHSSKIGLHGPPILLSELMSNQRKNSSNRRNMQESGQNIYMIKFKNAYTKKSDEGSTEELHQNSGPERAEGALTPFNGGDLSAWN